MDTTMPARPRHRLTRSEPDRRPGRSAGSRVDGTPYALDPARALSADDVAVAGLSHRCVLLFERHRMGGRGRRHQRCRDAARWLTVMIARRRRITATPCSSPMPIARPPATMTCAARGGRARRRLCAIEGAVPRNHGAGPRLSRYHPRGLALRALDRLERSAGTGPRASCRGRRRVRRARHSARSRDSLPICTRLRPISSRRGCASSRSASPMASACSPRLSRWWRRPPRAR